MNTCVLCKRQRDDDRLVPLGDRGLMRCADIDAPNCADEQQRAQRQQAEQQHLQAKERAAAQSAQRRVGGTCSLCGRTYRDGFAADGHQRDSGLIAFGDDGARRCASVASCAAEQERARRQEHERQVELRTAAALRDRKTLEPVWLSRGGLGW